MSSTWKTILIIFAIFLVGAAGYFGYRYYFQSKKSDLPVLSAITPSAVAFMEIPKPNHAFKKLESTDLWKYLSGLRGVQQVHRQAAFLDSALTINKAVVRYLELSRLTVSFNLTGEQQLQPVYILPVPGSLTGFSVDAFVADINGAQNMVMQKPFKDASIHVVNITAQNSFFYYTVYRGVFAGSFNEQLVRATIQQLMTGREVITQQGFRRVRQTAGQNVDANLYVNGRNFGRWALTLSNEEFEPLMQELTRFWDWTETDVLINDDELLFNGYSVASGNDSLILNCYRQDPQDITIPDILPYNVAYLTHFGLENFESFYPLYLHQRRDSTETLERLQSYKDKYGISPYDEFISWVGNEFAMAGIGPGKTGDIDQIAVVKTTDIMKARLALSEASGKVNRHHLLKNFELKIGDYQVRKISLPALTEILFGPLFRGVREHYYVLVKDYVVFANSTDALNLVIENFYKGKTLSGDINYQAFSNNISVRSNIYFYCNIRKSAHLSDALLSGPFNNWIQDNAGALGNLEGVALQLSFINQMFYTNIYLKYNPDYQEVNPSSWSFETEAVVTGRPCFIKNHRNNKLNTIVFDASNNMYLADHIGKTKWKLPLIEQPVGDPIQVDYYGNGKYQYLFNTSNYIYIVDLNGDYVAEFPVKLPQSSTGPIACFDYENDHDYRFVIPLNDNRIYNFDKSMQPVEGWNKVQTGAPVRKAVQHVVADGKDYFFITDEKGRLVITDRRGEERIKLKKSVVFGNNNSFYLNKTNSNGTFLSTDHTGNLTYIDENGGVSFTEFGNFSKDHYFFYTDFDGDDAMDFIYVDGNKVTIFNRFKKVIFEYPIAHPVQSKPVITETTDGKTLLGLILKESGEVILLAPGGRIYENAGITGTGPFTIGSIHHDGILNLIVPNGHEVKNFLLE